MTSRFFAFALGAAALFLATAQIAAANPDKDDAAIAACLADKSASDCAGLISAPCMEASPEAQTTLGMTQCFGREAEAWDRLLNADYQRLMTHLDAEQQEALRSAQRAWIVYRDETCIFPHILIRGSMAHFIGASCVADKTADRVDDLRGYLSYMGL